MTTMEVLKEARSVAHQETDSSRQTSVCIPSG